MYKKPPICISKYLRCIAQKYIAISYDSSYLFLIGYCSDYNTPNRVIKQIYIIPFLGNTEAMTARA